MFSSIRSKILTVLLGLAVVAVGIATWQHISSSLHARQQELKTSAISMGQLVGIKVVGPLLKRKESLSISQRKELTGWVNTTSDVNFISIYNPAGTKIFEYRENGKKLPDSPELDETLISNLLRSDQSLIGREIPGEQNYDLLVPLRLYGSNIGVVRLGLDVSRFYSEQRQLIYTNASFGLIVLLIVAICGYGLTNYLVRPINDLASAAARFGQGNLNVRTKIESGDEIQKLGEQFNTMANKIQQQIEDLRTIEEINREISAQLRPESLHDQIVNIINKTWDISKIALLLKQSDDQAIQVASGLNVRKDLNPESLENKLEEISEISKHESETGNSDNHKSLAEQVFNLNPDENIKDVKSLSLSPNGDNFGYLLLARTSATFTSSEKNLFPMLTHQISIALQNARNYVRAVTDDLTGLYTRRFFDLELSEKIESDEYHPLSLAMIDVDDFKEYNDTYGHPAGDKVLKVLANTLESLVRTSDVKEANRQSDTVARYGGEEFVIILPTTDLESAEMVSERIVDAVASLDDFEEQVTISLGVAKYRVGESKQTFVTRADDALYRAKNNGKNQVCVAGQ